MSEKKLIDWDGFYRFITSLEIPTQYTSSETNQLRKKAGKYWDGLSRPSLPDVCGTRTLDSMTEEEEIELSRMISLPLVCKPHLVSIIMDMIKADGIRFSVARWLIEKGFNVFGEVDK